MTRQICTCADRLLLLEQDDSRKAPVSGTPNDTLAAEASEASEAQTAEKVTENITVQESARRSRRSRPGRYA